MTKIADNGELKIAIPKRRIDVEGLTLEGVSEKLLSVGSFVGVKIRATFNGGS